MKIALMTTGACALAVLIALAGQGPPPEGRGPAQPPGPRTRRQPRWDHRRGRDACRAGGPGAARHEPRRPADAEELRPSFGPDGGPRGGPEGGGEAAAAPAASADELTDTLMAFDRNSDGRPRRAEVPERFQGLFDRADANRDGALTREELKQSAAANAAPPDGGGRGPRGGGGRGGPMGDPLLRALDTDRRRRLVRRGDRRRARSCSRRSTPTATDRSAATSCGRRPRPRRAGGAPMRHARAGVRHRR